MRRWVLLILCLGLLVRVAYWRTSREKTESICALWEKSAITKQYSWVTGSLVRLSHHRYALTQVRVGSEIQIFEGRIWVDPLLLPSGLDFGHKVRIRGPFRCQVPLRNPGRLSDRFLEFQEPQVFAYGKKFRLHSLAERSGFLAQGQGGFLSFLEKIFQSGPKLWGLELALWSGNSELLPESFRSFYEEGGLLHFLALSGIRVFGLVLVARFWLQLLFRGLFLFRWPLFRKAYCYLNQSLPVFACGLLLLTSQGAGPVVRMLGVAIGLLVLRLFRLECSPLQKISSSVAVLVVVSPALVANTGFFWSVVATSLLVQSMSEGHFNLLLEYIVFSVVMPVLVFPLSAFSSAKLSLLSPLHSLAVGWLWELVLIPVGYFLPLPLWLLPKTLSVPLIVILEKIWSGIVSLHSLWGNALGHATISVVRPTFIELGISECLLLFMALGLRGRIDSWVRRDV